MACTFLLPVLFIVRVGDENSSNYNEKRKRVRTGRELSVSKAKSARAIEATSSEKGVDREEKEVEIAISGEVFATSTQALMSSPIVDPETWKREKWYEYAIEVWECDW